MTDARVSWPLTVYVTTNAAAGSADSAMPSGPPTASTSDGGAADVIAAVGLRVSATAGRLAPARCEFASNSDAKSHASRRGGSDPLPLMRPFVGAGADARDELVREPRPRRRHVPAPRDPHDTARLRDKQRARVPVPRLH